MAIVRHQYEAKMGGPPKFWVGRKALLRKIAETENSEVNQGCVISEIFLLLTFVILCVLFKIS